MKLVYKETVLTGKNVGDKIFIPRMNLVSSEPELQFKLQSRQYSLVLCLTITINKNHGQSLSYVWVYLPHVLYSHMVIVHDTIKSKF